MQFVPTLINEPRDCILIHFHNYYLHNVTNRGKLKLFVIFQLKRANIMTQKATRSSLLRFQTKEFYLRFITKVLRAHKKHRNKIYRLFRFQTEVFHKFSHVEQAGKSPTEMKIIFTIYFVLKFILIF